MRSLTVTLAWCLLIPILAVGIPLIVALASLTAAVFCVFGALCVPLMDHICGLTHWIKEEFN